MRSRAGAHRPVAPHDFWLNNFSADWSHAVLGAINYTSVDATFTSLAAGLLSGVWRTPMEHEVDADCKLCGRVTTHQSRADGSLECASCRARLQVETERAAAMGTTMRYCAPCGGSTHHDERGCTRCRLMLDDSAARAAAMKARGGVSHARRNAGAAIFLGLAIVASGFFHCTYGGDHGFDVLPKEEWGFYDQFIDMSEIEGSSVITQLGRARTIRALIRHGAISLPPSWNGEGSDQYMESKGEVAKNIVRKLANEAYPQWAMKPSNNGKCPTLIELAEYMNSKDLTDPWGQEYVVMCGTNLPAGAAGIAIVSKGDDQKEGTGDDVKSWE